MGYVVEYFHTINEAVASRRGEVVNTFETTCEFKTKREAIREARGLAGLRLYPKCITEYDADGDYIRSLDPITGKDLGH
jgi:hypothetical protein